MGGIVSVTITKKPESEKEESLHYSERDDELSSHRYSLRTKITDVKSLSFPLQKRIDFQDAIPEENEEETKSRKKSQVSGKSLQNLVEQYQHDEKIKKMEEELMRDYEKWNIENRTNHEDAMASFARYNNQVSNSSHI